MQCAVSEVQGLSPNMGTCLPLGPYTPRSCVFWPTTQATCMVSACRPQCLRAHAWEQCSAPGPQSLKAHAWARPCQRQDRTKARQSPCIAIEPMGDGATGPGPVPQITGPGGNGDGWGRVGTGGGINAGLQPKLAAYVLQRWMEGAG